MVFAELVGKIYGAKRGLQRGIDHLVDELYCFTLSNLDPGTRHMDEGVIRAQVKRTWGTPGKAFLADIRNMTESMLKLLAIYSAKRGYALHRDPSSQSRLDDYLLAAFAANEFREIGRSLQKASDIYGVFDSIILPTKNESAVLRRVRALAEEYGNRSRELRMYVRFLEEYRSMNFLAGKGGYLLSVFYPRSPWARRLWYFNLVTELFMVYTLCTYLSIREVCRLATTVHHST